MVKDNKIDFSRLKIAKAHTEREWDAARNFRQKYFFDKVPMADPYTWTFEHKEHLHFICYLGADIIGYAHLQMWPAAKAALRIIVIDEACRNHGLGGEFLRNLELLLKQKDIKTMHVQSSPAAYSFYVKYQYSLMPFNDPEGHEAHPQDIEMGKDL
jgi:hypothetical protein